MEKFRHKFKIYKNGFTLAEVLITLVIIGVVAAMTIPTLVNRTNKEELRTGLLKAQSVLSGALEKFYTKNGYKLTPAELVYSGSGTRVYLKDKIMPYFSVAKDCGTASCANSTIANYKNFSGTTGIQYGLIDDGQFVLNDGMTVFIENYTGSIYIAVDVNGHEKKPNKPGHDLFFFQMNNEGNLVPMGAEGTDYYSATNAYCSKTSSSNVNGFGCTAKALNDANYFKNLP